MNNAYEKFKVLNIDTSAIGLSSENSPQYFCTPINSTIIGCDNSIHYIFIDGFGETVFAVNPETCCDFYVYPLAHNFSDFLSLILATKGTNTLQQIIQWDKSQYTSFINAPDEIEYASRKDVQIALTAIQSLGIRPMIQPFEYVKAIQKKFDYSKIPFNDDFYDITGNERP